MALYGHGLFCTQMDFFVPTRLRRSHPLSPCQDIFLCLFIKIYIFLVLNNFPILVLTFNTIQKVNFHKFFFKKIKVHLYFLDSVNSINC